MLRFGGGYGSDNSPAENTAFAAADTRRRKLRGARQDATRRQWSGCYDLCDPGAGGGGDTLSDGAVTDRH